MNNPFEIEAGRTDIRAPQRRRGMQHLSSPLERITSAIEDHHVNQDYACLVMEDGDWVAA